MKAKRTTTVAAVALFVAGSALAQTRGTYAPPPRTVEDILAVLEQYKPAPAVAGRARQTASLEAPTTTDDKELAQFYLKRGQAARNSGRVDQTIADLRMALDHARRASGMDDIYIMSELASAEVWGGNILNAIQLRREALAKLPAARWGWRMAFYAPLANYYLSLGDFAAVKQILADAESTIIAARKSTGWNEYQHMVLMYLEWVRWSASTADHKYAAAEQAARRTLQELDADTPRIRSEILRQRWDDANHAYHLQREIFEQILANSLNVQGKRTEAEVVYRTVLQRRLGRVGRASSETAVALRGLAGSMVSQGRYHDAELLLTAALESYRSAGATSMFATTGMQTALAVTLVYQRR